MINYAEILKNAHDAATAAANQYKNDFGEQQFNCGFAWVIVPTRSAFVKWCKDQPENGNYFGDKSYPKGYDFWCPGEFMGQDMNCHRAGAVAFAKVLKDELGIDAQVRYKLD